MAARKAILMSRRLANALLALTVLAALVLVPIGSAPLDSTPGSAQYPPAAYAQPGLPPLPSGWPSTLQLGRSDGPGGASGIKAKAPFAFRYQYLAGGVNTGASGVNTGWQTWQENTAPPGTFVTRYIDESIAQGMTPVFTYYMLLQSLPHSGLDEQAADLSNLNNTATMQAYWADLTVFFQRAAAYPNTTIVLHVEPDLWGYVQQAASNDNAASVPAKVGSTGVAALAGLPDNVAGFAQGVVRLRESIAPNVILGYHVSVWGTNVDIGLSDPSDAEVDALGNRAGAFYTSLGASFDVAFGEFSDRDSAYMQLVQGKGAQSWWDSGDFARHARFINRFVLTSGKRMVLWQIPFGNTKMRAENNTTHHYQDNRVEWLLDEPARSHLTAYVNAGAIGFLFGGGNGEVTDASDAAGDGVTNPAPINGNTRTSLSADDDGGFFYDRAAAYYAAGAMSLEAGAPLPPTNTPIPTTPTATPVPPITAPGAYTTSASASSSSVPPGDSTTITAAVTSGSAVSVLVDVEVYRSSDWTKVHQQFFDNQAFAAGQQRFYPVSWSVPSNAATGTYTVMIGVFHSGDWTPNYAWNNNAGTFTVGTSAPNPTPTFTPSPTTTAVPVVCNPRPPVQLGTTRSGNSLQVMVTATGQNNALAALQFTRTTNALVDVGGQSGRTGAFTVSLPGASATTSFTVRRAGPGAATVALTVVDGCGSWQTLVGGGPGAF
jgi:hypothetical protein